MPPGLEASSSAAAPRDPPAGATHLRLSGLAAALRAALSDTERQLMAGILAVAFLHGLTYLYLMPPWQHYDEPSHFEYAWLIAQTGRIPPHPTYAYDKRREILASMVDHGFFRDLRFGPNFNPPAGEPVWIGVNVTGGAPLYHLLVAGVFRLAPAAPVDTQLYLARWLSLALFLVTVAAAYGITAEVTPPGHALRWAVPAAVALVPAFAQFMTALNNDVGATAFYSLFLWAAARLARRGPAVPRLLATAATAGLCALTKNTVLVALPLLVVAVALALRGTPPHSRAPAREARRARRLAAGGLALALGLGAIVVLRVALRWGDAALWYRWNPATTQRAPTRVRVPGTAPGLGAYALALTSPDMELRQPIPLENHGQLTGTTATVGAWIWASEPLTANLPALIDEGVFNTRSTAVGTQPAFYAFTATVSERTANIVISLMSGAPLQASRPITVYYDGIVVAPGARPLDVTPAMADPAARRGTWDGQPFTNLARNASAEGAWPYVQPAFEVWFNQVLARPHLWPSYWLAALLDVRGSSWLYQVTPRMLFYTFWSRFGWGNVAPSRATDTALLAVTLVGVAGALAGLARSWRQIAADRRRALLWLGLAGLTVWAATLVRVLFGAAELRPYIPHARYAYPAIIPTLLLLVAGWARVGRLARGPLRQAGPVAFWLGFTVLDIMCAVAVARFYMGGEW